MGRWSGLRPLPVIVCLAACALWAQENESKSGYGKDKPAEARAEAVATRVPAMTSIYPMSGKPSQTVEFQVFGEFLDRANRVDFESPDVTGKVIEAGFTSAKVRATVAAGAEPGPRYFRVLTPRGATNLLVFRVSNWPQLMERPGGDGSLEKATPVTVPSLTSGILHADMSGMAPWGEEADLYRFHAKKGQRLRFTVFGVRNVGTRAGLPQLNADLSLTLLRADGHQLIWDEGRFIWEPYLDYTFEEEGDYIAALTVTRAPTTVVVIYPKYQPAYYQLAIGNAPQVWNVFPAGAQRGREVEVEMRADFMPPNPKLVLASHGLDGTIQKTADPKVYRLKLRSSADASLGMHHIYVRDESGTASPVRFTLGDLPERMEQEPNDSREQADKVAWPITINGRMDHRADQDWYRVDVKDGQKLSFDIEAENAGGSVMDASLTLTDALGKVLKYVDDGPRVGLGAQRDPKLTWTFEKAGTYYVKIENLFKQFGPEQIYRFTVHELQPDFRVALPGGYLARTEPRDRFNIPQGGKTELNITLARLDDFEGDVQVEARGLPAGVTAAPATIAAKQAATKLVLTAAPDAALADAVVRVVGRAKIGGQMEERPLLLPENARGTGPGFWDYRSSRLHITVASASKFSLEVLAETIFLVRGQSVDVPVKLDRAPGFTAPLKISLENLPPGVTLDKSEELDQGKQILLHLKAAESAAKARLSDLIVVGEAQAGGERYLESSPKTTLQLD
jgi:hypothetical protein